MAKKLVIASADLPNIIAGQTQVFIRFRVVSEDKNRSSAWTPIFSVTPSTPYINLNINEISNNINDLYAMTVVL